MSASAREIRVEPAAGGGLAVRFEAMASPCEVLAAGAGHQIVEHAGRLAAGEVWRIEALWSRYIPGNIVDRINTANGEPVDVDPETASFLDYAEHLYRISDGLFDVTSGVLRRVWHFDGSDRVPSAHAVAEILPLVGWDKVEWRRPRLRMKAGMQIDFGGIGKEYAVDRACSLAASACSLPVLVNCGGDLAASEAQPAGLPWRIGIDGAPENTPTPVIFLRRGGVASSGDVHRYLLKDGRRYPHVLDPRTGWPVLGGPRLVTVAASSCTEAGVLSTLALLHGSRAEVLLKDLEADYRVCW